MLKVYWIRLAAAGAAAWSVAVSAAVQEAWVARYNGPANQNDAGRAVLVDPEGHVYVTGQAANFNSYDIATIKYDATGKVLWVRLYDGPGQGTDMGQYLAFDSSGNLLVGGFATRAGQGRNAVILKYTPAGDLVWVRDWDAAGQDEVPKALLVDADDNVILAGYTRLSSHAFDFAYFCVKYNAQGDFLWAQLYDAARNYSDQAEAAAVDAAGNIYITGRSNANTGSGNDIVTVKYDAAGNELWVARLDGPAGGNDSGYAVAVDGLDYVYVGGMVATTTSGNDLILIKYTPDGQIVWTATDNGPGNGNDTATAIRLAGPDEIYVAGNISGPPPNGQDVGLWRFDGSGNLEWSRYYNTPANKADSAVGLVLDSRGHVVVAALLRNEKTTTFYDFDMGTLIYDRDGNLLYDLIYDGPVQGGDFTKDIALGPDDSIHVIGESFGGSFTGGGTGYDYATVKYVWPAYAVGDLNCDGEVNFGDINPFVLALTNPAGYAAQYPHCDIMLADINGDGLVDFGDINPFVHLLTQP